MQIPESPPTAHESFDLRAGRAGWQNLASGCLQLLPCRTLKFPGHRAQPPVWSRPPPPAIEQALSPELRGAVLLRDADIRISILRLDFWPQLRRPSGRWDSLRVRDYSSK